VHRVSGLLNFPDHVGRGVFVLKLSEGVERADKTLRTYVVTLRLLDCFDQVLSLMQSAPAPLPRLPLPFGSLLTPAFGGVSLSRPRFARSRLEPLWFFIPPPTAVRQKKPAPERDRSVCRLVVGSGLTLPIGRC
jgi:hypothetical protein